MGDLKEALSTDSSGMNHSLRNPLPGEVSNLLDQMVVLKKNRTSFSDGEGGDVVGDRSTAVCGVERSVVRARRTVLQEP